MEPATYILIAGLAFCLQAVDSAVGMGFGTAMVPLLVLFGVPVSQAIMLVLVVNGVNGLLAGIVFHRVGIVDANRLANRRLFLAVTVSGAVTVMLAVWLSRYLTDWLVQVTVAVILAVIGFGILIQRVNRGSWPQRVWQSLTYNWRPGSVRRASLTGLLAGFVKGLTGGGYGAIIASGQVLVGMEEKRAVAIAVFAEGLLSVVGAFGYLLLDGRAIRSPWLLVAVLAGSLPALFVSASILKRMNGRWIGLLIGIGSIVLGLVVAANALGM